MKDYYFFIMSSYIFLDRIRFFAHHGAGRQETLVGNEFVVSLRLNVGGRIVKRLFGDFPPIEDIELKLSKRNPPMGADIEAAGIEIHTSRQQQ